MVNQAVIKPSLSFYFPELSNLQLFDALQLSLDDKKYSEILLKQHWEAVFLQDAGLPEKNIPWNLLRALQFNIPNDIKTVVCCDPVMMQMTHRGAYLWGQQSLEFSKEDVIRIIAQINQQLMSEDECFYLLDNNQWLYTNKKAIELKQPSFEEYIGKDMFGFYYNGKDGTYWDKLATEIQMLIKQMMDYQGLKTAPPEMIVNVHFWGNTNDYLFDNPNLNTSNNIELKEKSPEVNVFSSNHLIEIFSKIKKFNFMNLNDVGITDFLVKEKNIVFIFNNDLTKTAQLLQVCFEETKQFESIKLITQDKLLLLKAPKNWLEKAFLLLNKFRNIKGNKSVK